MEKISASDREIIRKLAAVWAEEAASDRTVRLKKLWLAHNMREAGRSMVTLESAAFAGDAIPQLQRCCGEVARKI